MAVSRRIAIGFVGVIVMLVIAACQSASATKVTQAVSNSTPSTPSDTPTSQPGAVLWGRVPYCNCLADSATANVAGALKNASLKVDLKELSPSEGWLYFAVTFDPNSATGEQVSAAMKAGGAEILSGPP